MPLTISVDDRSRSVSSMRSTNVPPCGGRTVVEERRPRAADVQVSVGDGANLTRGATADYSMTLNHLNLTVADPSETSAFLAKHFGLRPRGGNLGIQMLNDDNGMVLTLIKARREDIAEGARPDGVTEGALRAEGAGKPAGAR
jgi:hypothetical protein